jgi:hypothetical protein
MSARPKFVIEIATLAVLATMSLSACSSSQPQDINIGTDVGLGYVPPDADNTVLATDAATLDSVAGDTWISDAADTDAISDANDAAISGIDDAGVSEGGPGVDASADAGD